MAVGKDDFHGARRRGQAMNHIGIDEHKKESQICIPSTLAPLARIASRGPER